MMPEMDGFETCERIKASTAWREIPIIFLTAKTDTADIVRGFELGAVDYVAKPFSAHELLARVKTHLTLDHLFRENQRLLLNVLPAKIAEKLKQQVGIIAERFDDVTVLFADIVGFTPISARLSPTELVELLNRVFSGFDEITGRARGGKNQDDRRRLHGGRRPDRTESGSRRRDGEMALAMLDSVRQLDEGLDLRIGLHVGSVVAGVIGIRKFIYDIWGDTVNIASRLESHGAPGRVHVSEAVFQRLQGRFLFDARGAIELKGRGSLNTYYLSAPA